MKVVMKFMMLMTVMMADKWMALWAALSFKYSKHVRISALVAPINRLFHAGSVFIANASVLIIHGASGNTAIFCCTHGMVIWVAFSDVKVQIRRWAKHGLHRVVPRSRLCS